MRQRWRDLLFLHWSFPPEVIRPLVPPSLGLDLFEGMAFVGLVPFSMSGVRPTGLPAVRGLSSFHETNVRTYVHFRGGDPGVWFFSLDAANWVAVRLARRFFHLPYQHARMFLEHEGCKHHADSPTILYAGVRDCREPGAGRASYLVRGQAIGQVQPAVPGTLEHFLTERYLLYACWRDCLYLGQVHHKPYPLQPARVLSLDENLLAAAHIERPPSPPLVHFASGVDVEVFRIRAVGQPAS
jgi:uncharacterized protein YqjF (DUF2071 family)